MLYLSTFFMFQKEVMESVAKLISEITILFGRGDLLRTEEVLLHTVMRALGRESHATNDTTE